MHGDVLEGRTPNAGPECSAEPDGWMRVEPDPTLGALVAAFGHKSFAIVFMLLLCVPALPLRGLSAGAVRHSYRTLEHETTRPLGTRIAARRATRTPVDDTRHDRRRGTTSGPGW